jgi:hypothetical protein
MSAACHHRSSPATDPPICAPMRNLRLIPASVIAVCAAGVVLYAIALGTDVDTGRYGPEQTVALVVGFLVFVGAVRYAIVAVRGVEA